jgi:hypothetical protein
LAQTRVAGTTMDLGEKAMTVPPSILAASACSVAEE